MFIIFRGGIPATFSPRLYEIAASRIAKRASRCISGVTSYLRIATCLCITFFNAIILATYSPRPPQPRRRTPTGL